MKVKVEKQFKDRHTKVIHHVGDEIEVSEKRLNEIMEAQEEKGIIIVSEIPEEDPDKKTEPDEEKDETKEDVQESDVSALKLEELRMLAAELGLDPSGKKAELIEKINAKMMEEQDEESQD